MKNKHLSYDERLEIESGLKDNLSFKQIAKNIDRDCTTISKEIKNHIIFKNSGAVGRPFFDCLYRYNCPYKKKGKKCIPKLCEHYKKESCEKLKKPPYVCNGCSKRNICTLSKQLYDSTYAFKEYKDNLQEARTGITYSEKEIEHLNNILIPLIKDKKQSIHHAMINNKNTIMCSEKEIYNLVNLGVLEVRNIDLPRKVRMKKRKSKKTETKDTKARTNRTYEDFQKYIEQNPELPIVEMDTVEGTKGGRVLLTLLFRTSRLMLAFLLYEKTQKEVLRIFNMLEYELGNELFEKTFPVILTDNGTEFGNPLSLEFNEDGIGRTRIFYCNPRASYQKGMIEKNHEFIRYVLPKGTSFEGLLQTDINLMINHINSLGRNSLNWFSPIDVAKFTLDKDVLKKLNLVKISPDKIQLNTKLLKKN